MQPQTVLIDQTALQSRFAARGFNELDIECLLDLTPRHLVNGKAYWALDQVERLASRAYWLPPQPIALGQAA